MDLYSVCIDDGPDYRFVRMFDNYYDAVMYAAAVHAKDKARVVVIQITGNVIYRT